MTYLMYKIKVPTFFLESIFAIICNFDLHGQKSQYEVEHLKIYKEKKNYFLS